MGDADIMEKTLKMECCIPFTIEKQLKAYAECKEHTERHEILWHEWNHNKRWLILVQQLILPSFPSYSMHDVTHSQAVLHNIEMLLGENNIKSLSASDCFLILHTVYIHDIGMCITDDDRRNIIEDKKFHDFLEHLSQDDRNSMNQYAGILLEECREIERNPNKETNKTILNRKLDIYYAVTYLLSEYCRMEHGDISKKRLVSWINSSDTLGVGFSTIEIPDRLFYIIANCANTHTKWDFEEVLKLNQEDSGYAHDYVHPRFIAILLQLGDALDMDNDRFHPLFKEYLGDIPHTSEIHYGKHKAIRRLRITNQKISISADCKDQDILRLVRQECDGIKSILQNATYYWSVIRPKESNIGLPTFDKVKLLLDGNEIPEELVETKFEIPQDKAFHLLEGNSIYQDNKFVFLREFLQNAIDATKIQYFRDCKRQKGRVHIEDITQPNEIQKVLSPLSYPVEISFTIAKREKQKVEEARKKHLIEIDEGKRDITYGVLVSIRDYGTGISGKDIKQIAKIGTSYESRKNEINKMPGWLKTTGIFGIGLQSAFLSSDVIIAETYTRKDECYEITFYPRRNTFNGYINVKPVEDNSYTKPYGTTFKTFVPFEKKQLHKDSPETWDGIDPFEKGYDKMRVARHSRELIKQMALYLADMVGEPLFPINLYINDGFINDDKELNRYYNEGFKNRFKSSGMNLYVNNKSIQNNLSCNSQVSWAYNLDNNKYIIINNEDIYFFNPEKIKLYIWNHKYNAFACFGVGRILSIRENVRHDNNSRNTGVKIFYKGIKVSDKSFKQDANLIEYIDLKDSLKEDFLRLNRSGFSGKGYEYLEEVYHAILYSGHNALKLFTDENYNEAFTDYKEEITKNIYKLLNNGDIKVAEERILSVAVLVYFAMVNEKHELFKENSQEYKKEWNKLLGEIINPLRTKPAKRDDERENLIMAVSQITNGSTLFKVPVFAYRGEEKDISLKTLDRNNIAPGELSVLDIIDINRKFVIISKRNVDSGLWTEYIVEIRKGEENGVKQSTNLNGNDRVNTYDEIKENIQVLHNEHNVKNRNKATTNLNKIANDIMKGDYTYNDENKKKHIKIIKWFLNNVPTIALFASEDGNTRLNILDIETCDSVYFDENMKKLIIFKMLSAYKNHNISRFSTTVWSGYRYLALEQNRNSILYVKRGKMSSIGLAEMIFPLTGKHLQQLLDSTKILHTTQTKEITDLYNKFLNVIFTNLSKNDYTDKRALINRLLDMINKFIDYVKDKDKNKDYTNIKLAERDGFSDDECREYIDKLESDANEGNDRLEPKEKMDRIICASLKKMLDLMENLNKLWDIELTKKELIINEEEAYKNMIEYVTKNVKMKIKKEQIETLYGYFVDEIFITIKQIRYDILKQELIKDEIFSKPIFSKLLASYEP